MLSLEEKIVRDGLALGTQIVKVDSFLNHQIDVAFLHEIGDEFARLFADERPTKILTMESSGIACAIAAAQALGDLPVVFAKKTMPSTMVEDIWYADVKSFTKGTVSRAVVARKFLHADDRVLIIDDFLAHGEAGMGMIEICRQAGAEVVGMGAIRILLMYSMQNFCCAIIRMVVHYNDIKRERCFLLESRHDRIFDCSFSVFHRYDDRCFHIKVTFFHIHINDSIVIYKRPNFLKVQCAHLFHFDLHIAIVRIYIVKLFFPALSQVEFLFGI